MGTLTPHPTFPAMKLLASDGGCHCGTHLALHNRKLRKLRKLRFKQIQAVSVWPAFEPLPSKGLSNPTAIAVSSTALSSAYWMFG